MDATSIVTIRDIKAAIIDGDLPDYREFNQSDMIQAMVDRGLPTHLEDTLLHRMQMIDLLMHDDIIYINRTNHARQNPSDSARRHNSQPAVGFLNRLAREVRLVVYELVFSKPGTIYNNGGYGLLSSASFGCDLHREPGLLRVCQQIRDEAMSMYYSRQHYEFHSAWPRGRLPDWERLEGWAGVEAWFQRLESFALPYIRILKIIRDEPIEHTCDLGNGSQINSGTSMELHCWSELALVGDRMTIKAHFNIRCNNNCGVEHIREEVQTYFEPLLQLLRSGMSPRSLYEEGDTAVTFTTDHYRTVPPIPS